MWSQCRCVVYVLAQHSHKFFNERLAALPVARIPTHSRNTAGAIGRRERIFAGISPARATVAHRPEEMHRDQDSLTHRYYRCHGWEFIAILPEKLIISKVFERVAWFDFQRLRLLDGTGNNVTCTSSPVIGKSCDHTRTRGSWWSFQLFFFFFHLKEKDFCLCGIWNSPLFPSVATAISTHVQIGLSRTSRKPLQLFVVPIFICVSTWNKWDSAQMSRPEWWSRWQFFSCNLGYYLAIDEINFSGL